jgi:hypothetical protein
VSGPGAHLSWGADGASGRAGAGGGLRPSFPERGVAAPHGKEEMGRLDRDVLSLLNLNDPSDLDRAQGLSKRLHRQETARQ